MTHGLSIGLRTQSSASLIAKIKQGLPISSFDRLCRHLDLPEKELARTLHIPVSTLARRKKSGRMSFEESERLFRVARLYDRAREVFGDEEQARAWLRLPAWGLGDVVPLAHAETELGAREVDELLGRIEHGVLS